ncbi:prenyltransferase/squalene oxidase repeat-containing protein [Streptomyces sp. NPDC028722]|uniref:prenyltransferase/squalene oxidase repeat-containing protein n=1 Tax=Streptomyces sp. NPDC028722 TaxID=3155016 RepID=UPI003403A09D
MTANAILALAPDPARYTPLLHRAALHLLDAQAADGTFERSWSLTHTHGLRRVTAALTCLPPTISTPLHRRLQAALRRAGAYCERAQNSDGGFGHQPGDDSDISSTAHALSVAAALNRPAWTGKALAYLLAREEPGGTFTSRPEQVAPRPIPYHHPAHPAVFALTALGAV